MLIRVPLWGQEDKHEALDADDLLAQAQRSRRSRLLTAYAAHRRIAHATTAPEHTPERKQI